MFVVHIAHAIGRSVYYYVHFKRFHCIITVGKVEKFQYIEARCTQYISKQQLVHSNSALHFIVVYRYGWWFCFRIQFMNQVCARAHRISYILCFYAEHTSRSQWKWTHNTVHCSLLKWVKWRLLFAPFRMKCVCGKWIKKNRKAR